MSEATLIWNLADNSPSYAYTPLLVLFEPDPPMPEDLEKIDPNKTPGVQDTALMIPCYKAAMLIGPTLAAATKIFPPSHIFVIANGEQYTLRPPEDPANLRVYR